MNIHTHTQRGVSFRGGVIRYIQVNTKTLCAFVCVFARRCAPLLCVLPPRSASRPRRTRRRHRTKLESSRFSSRIPGDKLSSSSSSPILLLRRRSPWMCPRDPPLRSAADFQTPVPPVYQRKRSARSCLISFPPLRMRSTHNSWTA